ncbi:MAG TPA: CHAT domain-containing protein [Allosphingosinicella sp.]|jgi:hypothetical protein
MRTAASPWALGLLFLLPSCASVNDEALKQDRLQLGRNLEGDPCRAMFTRQDQTLTAQDDSSFAIACRSATSSRSIGFLRSTRSSETIAKIEATFACGASTPVTLAGVGRARARRCFDSTVGAETVVLDFERGGRTFIGSAQPLAHGPLEDGLRQFAGGVDRSNPDRATAPSFALAAVAAPPESATRAAGAEFDPQAALAEGTSLNQRGLHSDASRLLNDAISRIGPDTPRLISANLYLEAALADSNIRFAESAAERFARADRIIAEAGLEDPVLLRKRDTFRALDRLNRRDFRGALVALDRLLEASDVQTDPLRNPAILDSLNQSPAADRRSAARAIAPARDDQLLQMLLAVQGHWGRSNALRTLGRSDEAEKALARAFEIYESILPGRPTKAQILWLKARLERQRGRLAAGRGDWGAADSAFVEAIKALNEGAAANAWTGREPAIADAMLERAVMLGRQDADKARVREAFVQAVDAMIESKAAGSIDPSGLELYLDLLAQEAMTAPRADTHELALRALQAVGQPAVARQLNRLNTVVAADPELGARFREREDLGRRLTALRYEIGSAPEAQRGALEKVRIDAQRKLDAIEVELAQSPRASNFEDRPVNLAEIKAALREGEVYFKVAPVGRRLFGFVLTKEKPQIYAIDSTLDAAAGLAATVRDSIDGGLRTQKRDIRRFKVPESYLLFRLLTGPATDTLLAARAIVVEPAGPLERLPIGVLVTDQASVERYKPRSRSRDVRVVYDYSDLAFLASRVELSTAVSPRSFIIARNRGASTAPQPFIGFAEHSQQSAINLPAAGNVEVGGACFADAARLRELMQINAPISRDEVVVAKTALGFPQAPVVAGSDFTDVSVQARRDLDQYQILHFATHGLEEGRFGCPMSPPALLTSVGEPSSTGDRNSDGLLSFDEVAGMRLDANLVVLSACETAGGASQELARRSGQEEGGSTLEGLVRAFLTANSRAVLATYWQVSAEVETNDLIRNFYAAARTENIGASLQSAQRGLIRTKDVSHPFFWGAYFVVGDSSKMMLSPPGGPGPRVAGR